MSAGSIRPALHTIDGLPIRIAESEREPARNVDALLLSPWPESVYAFEPTWSRLASQARLVAVDLPGFGHSERRDALMSPQAMGAFIVRLAVVGPDIGTAAALFAAAMHPGRFRSLVVGVLREWVEAPDLQPYRRIDGRQIVSTAIATLERYALSETARDDYPQRALKLIRAMSRNIEQSVDVLNRKPLGPLCDFDDLVAGTDLALLQHAEIEPRPMMRHQESRDPRIVHADPDAITSHARLRHLEQRAADAIPVADADLVVREAFHGEVLAELPEGEIAAAWNALPIPIRVDLVDHHRTLLAAVTGKVFVRLLRGSAAEPRSVPEPGASVCTVSPRHGMFCGKPTLTASNLGLPVSMHDRVHQQALRIDKDVPLLALDLIARIVAGRIDAGPLTWGVSSQAHSFRHCACSWALGSEA